MQYHSRSLADIAHFNVDLIGYGGSKCHDAIAHHPNIQQSIISPFQLKLPRVLFLILAPCKVVYQLLQIFSVLSFRIRVRASSFRSQR